VKKTSSSTHTTSVNNPTATVNKSVSPTQTGIVKKTPSSTHTTSANTKKRSGRNSTDANNKFSTPSRSLKKTSSSVSTAVAKKSSSTPIKCNLSQTKLISTKRKALSSASTTKSIVKKKGKASPSSETGLVHTSASPVGVTKPTSDMPRTEVLQSTTRRESPLKGTQNATITDHFTPDKVAAIDNTTNKLAAIDSATTPEKVAAIAISNQPRCSEVAPPRFASASLFNDAEDDDYHVDSEDDEDSGGEMTIASKESLDCHDCNAMIPSKDTLGDDDDQTYMDLDAGAESESSGSSTTTNEHTVETNDTHSIIKASRKTLVGPKWTTHNLQSKPTVTFRSSFQSTHVLTFDTYNLLNDAISNCKDFGNIKFSDLFTNSSSMIRDNVITACEEVKKLMVHVNEYFRSEKNIRMRAITDSICFAIAVLTIKVMTGGEKKYETGARALLVYGINGNNLVDEIAYSTIAKMILDVVIKADKDKFLAKELTGYWKVPCNIKMKHTCHMIPDIYEHTDNELVFAFDGENKGFKRPRRKGSLWTHKGCKKWLLDTYGIYDKPGKRGRKDRISLSNADVEIAKADNITNPNPLHVANEETAEAGDKSDSQPLEREQGENGEHTNVETTDRHQSDVLNAVKVATVDDALKRKKAIEELGLDDSDNDSCHVEYEETAMAEKKADNQEMTGDPESEQNGLQEQLTSVQPAMTSETVDKKDDNISKEEHANTVAPNNDRTFVPATSINDIFYGDTVLIAKHRSYKDHEGEVTKFLRGNVIVKIDQLDIEIRCRPTDIKVLN